MSTRATKTIDDLGIQTYTQFEENRIFYEEKYVSESKEIAYQLGTDVFEPILVPEYQTLFELGKKGVVWGMIRPPPRYNEQKKRLFTHQLAPKLGPQDLIDIQITRIDERSNDEGDPEISREADKLILMMKDINEYNKIIAYINAERFRYSKG